MGRKKLPEWQRRLARYERTELTAAECSKQERASVPVLNYWWGQVEAVVMPLHASVKPQRSAAIFGAVDVMPRR